MSASDGKLYVVHFADDEPEFYGSQEEAVEVAAAAVKEMWDPSTLQYHANVDKIFVAEIVAFAMEENRVDRPPKEELDDEGFDQNGIDWSDGHEYICDYEMKVLPNREPTTVSNAVTVH